jgi:hypothetical protein
VKRKAAPSSDAKPKRSVSDKQHRPFDSSDGDGEDEPASSSSEALKKSHKKTPQKGTHEVSVKSEPRASLIQHYLRHGVRAKPTLALTQAEKATFDGLIHEELDLNGGARFVVAYQRQIDAALGGAPQALERFAEYFLSVAYGEDEATGRARFVIGIVRDCVGYVPDILDYFADSYPFMNVKSSLIGNSKEIETLKLSEYKKRVHESYVNGTYCYGPLLQTSIVGVRSEEIGGYFPKFIDDFIETNPFLRLALPWSRLSVNENIDPRMSDDGPIIWARPGEQMIPTSQLKFDANKKK